MNRFRLQGTLFIVLLLNLMSMKSEALTLREEMDIFEKLLKKLDSLPAVQRRRGSTGDEISISFYSAKDEKPDRSVSNGSNSIDSDRMADVYVVRVKPMKAGAGGVLAFYFDAQSLTFIGWIEYR